MNFHLVDAFQSRSTDSEIVAAIGIQMPSNNDDNNNNHHIGYYYPPTVVVVFECSIPSNNVCNDTARQLQMEFEPFTVFYSCC